MTGIKAALDALFADAHLARDVVYTAEGGAPVLVRAILRRPDDVTNFGDARIWSETTRLDLRLAEVRTRGPATASRSTATPSSSRASPSATASGWSGPWI